MEAYGRFRERAIPTRSRGGHPQNAWETLTEYTDEAFTARTRGRGRRGAYAVKFGEDESSGAASGLLHDFDYETLAWTPRQHPHDGAPILVTSYPEEVIEAVNSMPTIFAAP